MIYICFIKYSLNSVYFCINRTQHLFRLYLLDVITVSGISGGVFGVIFIIIVAVYLKCRKLKSNTYLRRRFRDIRGKICFKLVYYQFHS